MKRSVAVGTMGLFFFPLALFLQAASDSAVPLAKGPHLGSLSAIDECRIGHVEVSLNRDTLELWFLEGAENRLELSPLTQKEFFLTILPDADAPNPGLTPFYLTMKPAPLSGEKEVSCTHFVGRNDAVRLLKTFSAYGWVWFKGRMRPFEISFPEGLHVNSTGNASGSASK